MKFKLLKLLHAETIKNLINAYCFGLPEYTAIIIINCSYDDVCFNITIPIKYKYEKSNPGPNFIKNFQILITETAYYLKTIYKLDIKEKNFNCKKLKYITCDKTYYGTYQELLRLLLNNIDNTNKIN